MERNIRFQGNLLTLVGRNIKEGMIAPDFKLVAPDLREISLSSLEDKIKVLTSFPSLDTPVCDFQLKEFNKRATGFGPEVLVIGISKDLPFAQKRFCDAFGIKNVRLASDYRASSFGINYGLQIKKLNLLARSVIILDKNNVIRYIQLVPELTNSPDYATVEARLEEVVKNPALPVAGELPSKCTPCEKGVTPVPISKEKIEELLAKHRGWELIEAKKLTKEFLFKDFMEAKYFLDLVSLIAEEQGHHPTMTIIYNKLKITLTTHAAGGLTENDFIMARVIDDVGGSE